MSNFDKFIDDILLKERTRKKEDSKKGDEETPGRKYAKLYREKTNNRIVYKKP